MFRYIISIVAGLTLMELFIQYDSIEKMVFKPRLPKRRVRINTNQLRRTLTLGSNPSNYSHIDDDTVDDYSSPRKGKRKKSKSKEISLNNYEIDGKKLNLNLKNKKNSYRSKYIKGKRKSGLHDLVNNFSRRVDEIFNEEKKNDRSTFIKTHSSPPQLVKGISSRTVDNFLDNTEFEGLGMVKNVGSRKNYPVEDTSKNHHVEDTSRTINIDLDSIHNVQALGKGKTVGNRKDYLLEDTTNDNRFRFIKVHSSPPHLAEDTSRIINIDLDKIHNVQDVGKWKNVGNRKNYPMKDTSVRRNIYDNIEPAPTEKVYYNVKNVHVVDERLDKTEKTDGSSFQPRPLVENIENLPLNPHQSETSSPGSNRLSERTGNKRTGNELAIEPKSSIDLNYNKFLRVVVPNENMQRNDKKQNRKKNRKKRKNKKKNKKKKKKKKISNLKKEHTLLAVGILSKLPEIKRRDAIRNTWYTSCVHVTSKAVCRFFTDEIRNDTKNKEVYYNERHEKNDLVYMHSQGINFSKWLLWMFEWFTEHYDFDFFLRVDDDYFVCFDRLLNELPHRPTGLYWGWIHCQPGIVRVDEAFMILSRDIIDEIMERINETLLCHPFGDQAMASWIYNIENDVNVTYFMDNRRLVHQVTSYLGDTYLVPNLCNRYLGLHGTYPEYMYKYWRLYSDDGNQARFGRRFTIPPIIPFQYMCQWSPGLDFYQFHEPFYAVPKPCKSNPIFSRTVFKGREGQTTRRPYVVRNVPVTERRIETVDPDYADYKRLGEFNPYD